MFQSKKSQRGFIQEKKYFVNKTVSYKTFMHHVSRNTFFMMYSHFDFRMKKAEKIKKETLIVYITKDYSENILIIFKNIFILISK